MKWLSRLRALRPLQWLAVAGYALLLASIFRGAEFALDALNGPQRRKADMASHLGGLELWMALCAVAAFAVMAAAASACRRLKRGVPRRRRNN